MEENRQTDETRVNNGVFNKIWNHPAFEKAAIVFNQLFQWVEVPLYGFLTVLFFKWEGITWTIFGVVTLIYCLYALFSIIGRFQKKAEFRKNGNNCPVCGAMAQKYAYCSNCGSAMPKLGAEELDDPGENTGKNLADKKKKMVNVIAIAAVVGIFFACGGMLLLFGSPITNLKDSKFIDNDGDKTIGEMIDDNFKNEKWSYEKIDGDAYYVYVKGLMPILDEEVEVKFYCEIDYDFETMINDTGEYAIEGHIVYVKLLDSGEKLDDVFSISMFIAILTGEYDDFY